MLKRGDSELSVIEAVDNLSNMADIDLKTPHVDEFEVDRDAPINWRDPRQALLNEPALKETFTVVHKYLQNMVRSDQNSLKDPQVTKGIQAIMLLASEAAEKMDKYAGLYPKHYKSVSSLKEYQDLQKYYRQQILKQGPKPKEVPEEWEEDIEAIETAQKGLRDLESVRKDEKYELFFIKDENKRPYFNKSLLRHVRMVGNFDELISKAEGEDPLLHLRELLDWEIFEGAKELLHLCAPYIDDFYKEGMKHKKRPYIGSLNKAIMALRMAANSTNLIENQSFKSCLEYYADFHRFLRDALKAPGYIKRITEGAFDYFSQALLKLTHALCCYFFMRIEPKKNALKIIHLMDERGKEMLGPRSTPKAERKELQLFQDLRTMDEHIRFLLRHYPNGPIFRTLDAFREKEEFDGFDPLTHFNFPAQVFNILSEDRHITLMRLPCPTVQRSINSADVVDEFLGLIRFYANDLKPDKHLIVNLQDRTSWEEFARCKALEAFSLGPEAEEVLYVLGLPKDGEFYDQSGAYETMNGAPVFIEQLQEQFLGREGCGFYWSPKFKSKQLDDFVTQICKVIHEAVFQKKTTLKKKERLAFIELVYLLLTLKVADMTGCDSISFVCKDGLDTSPAMTAMLYGCVQLLSGQMKWSETMVNELLWMVYSPALLVRDRAIHGPRVSRMLITLEVIAAGVLDNQKGIVKEVNKLFKTLSFPADIQVPEQKS